MKYRVILEDNKGFTKDMEFYTREIPYSIKVPITPLKSTYWGESDMVSIETVVVDSVEFRKYRQLDAVTYLYRQVGYE